MLTAFSALILLYLSLVNRDVGDRLTTGHKRIESKVEEKYGNISDDLDSLTDFAQNQAVVRPIRESNFYENFSADVKQSEQRVDISYFDNKDPRDSEDETKVQYYEEVGDTIKRKSSEGVEFRRIIRAIPELDDWVEDIIEEHEGTSRYSLACIPDSEPHIENKPHVSVQLIDGEITYFVAVGEQMEGSHPRDMCVRSEEMNSQWTRYFQSLWDDSFVVLRRGTIQEDEFKEYKEHIENLW